MEKRIMTKEMIRNFKNHLIEDEKSSATLEKYMRFIVEN